MTEILYKVPEFGKEIELKVVKAAESVVKMNANDMKKLNVAVGDKIDLIGPKTKAVQVFDGADPNEIQIPEEILNEVGVREGVVLSVRRSIKN